jgi:hypothetical protein
MVICKVRVFEIIGNFLKKYESYLFIGLRAQKNRQVYLPVCTVYISKIMLFFSSSYFPFPFSQNRLRLYCALL